MIRAILMAPLLLGGCAGLLAAGSTAGDADTVIRTACANPPSGDALATAIWLGQLVGQIATLTSAAPAT
jgi:hypothetical protein